MPKVGMPVLESSGRAQRHLRSELCLEKGCKPGPWRTLVCSACSASVVGDSSGPPDTVSANRGTAGALSLTPSIPSE